MTICVDTLFTLEVTHAFHGGTFRDIAYVLPADTMAACASRHLLLRRLDGRLHVLLERRDDTPLADPTGLVLRIGLRPVDPSFSAFTHLAIDPRAPLLLFDNATDPDRLSAGQPARLVSSRFTHTISDTARPVTLRLLTAAGAPLADARLEDATPTWSCFLAHQPAGPHRVEETFPSATAETHYYHDPELAAATVLAVCEIRVHAFFLATPAAFTVPFTAREEFLNYYVIAHGFSASELAQLQITDTGFSEDGRPQLVFERHSEAQFGAGEIPPALIRTSADTVVLFRSQAPVPRRATPRRRIELRRQTETLIAHLPSPQPHQPSADLIIRISKH